MLQGGEDDTETWLEADPAEDPTDDSYPHTYEHSLDRVACALGGQAVLPPAFTFIPAMLASHDWRLRHAGLMAIASIAEGTSKVMQGELGKVIECVRVLPRLSLCARAHSRSQPGYPCVQRPASACALRGVSMHVSAWTRTAGQNADSPCSGQLCTDLEVRLIPS